MAKGGFTRAGYRAGAKLDRLIQRMEDAGMDSDDAFLLPATGALAGAEAYAVNEMLERKRRRDKNQAKAEGGPIRNRLDELGLAFKLLNPGLTEIGSNLGDAARHFPHGFRTQWMGLDDQGRPRGALYSDWEAPKDQWVWNDEAQMALPPQRGVTPGLVSDTLALPAFFGYKGSDTSNEAMAQSGALEETLREEYDVPAPESWGDFLGESAGIMGAQVPVPSGMLKGPVGALGKYVPKAVTSAAEAIKRVPGVTTAGKVVGAVPEFMLPTIDPSLGNYALGTGAGAALMRYLPRLRGEEGMPESGEEDLSQFIDWSDPSLEQAIEEDLASGALSPEEAENYLSIIRAERAKLEPPPLGGSGMAKGGKVKPPISLKDRYKTPGGYHIFQSLTPDQQQAAIEGLIAFHQGKITPEEARRQIQANPDLIPDLLEELPDPEPPGLAKGGRVDLPAQHRQRMVDLLEKKEPDYKNMTDAEVEEHRAFLERLRRLPRPEQKAKGGKVRPPTDKLALRERIAQLMRESEAPSAHPLVPVDPPMTETNLPSREAPMVMPESMPPPPDTNQPSILDKPMSRRDMLRGMGHVAGAAMSPVDIDPLSLIGPELEGLARSVETAPVAAVAKAMSPAQVASTLNEIFQTVTEDSDGAFFDQAISLAKTLPHGEGMAQRLQDSMNRFDEGLNNDPAKEYREEFESLIDDLQEVADANGIISLPEQWEDMGSPESGPGPLSLVSGPRWVEPEVSGMAEVMDDLLEKQSPDWGYTEPAEEEYLENARKWFDSWRPRADKVLSEWMSALNPEEFSEAYLDKYGIDMSIGDAIIDRMESVFGDHRGLEKWAEADPALREEFRQLSSGDMQTGDGKRERYLELLDQIYPEEPYNPSEYDE